MLVSTLSRPPVRLDQAGSGYFKAPRSGRVHYGQDRYAYPHCPVHAENDCEFVKLGQVFAGAPQYRYIEVLDGVLHVQYMYVEPTQTFINGQIIRAGQLIGHAQDIAAHYPKSAMQNHVHIACFYEGRRLTRNEVDSIYHEQKDRTYIDPQAYFDGKHNA